MRLVSATMRDVCLESTSSCSLHYLYTTDEGRPSCTRCIKSGNHCKGYQDSHTFVWVGTRSSDLKQTTANSGASSSTTVATASSEILSLQPTSTAQQKSFFASIDPLLLQDFINPVLPMQLDYHAFQESIYQTHLFHHLLGHTETGKKGVLSAPIQNSTSLNRFVIFY